MKQLTQNLKSGNMKVLEVPYPALAPKNVLVRVHYSLISAGTEASKVSTARKGYLGKAKEKPDQVKQVLDTLKKEGVASTYRKVMNKLDAWAPLGYSCSGEVIEVGKEVSGLKVGDYVACAGQDIANHAEVVSVPINLCAKIPLNCPLNYAAFTTVGTIALQGIRQADLRLGESCAVIGLGLLGQLTVQMLNASGVHVYGIDINPINVEKALESGADLAFERSNDVLENRIMEATSGYGVDAVIITAGTNSLDPIELAGRISRSKGRVVIVGAVPTGFSRENYYKKELELRMSCSYGPGRYDLAYEDRGIDYPYGYVRWTENRNMSAFLDLISQDKIDLSVVTSHEFELEKANEAFELIMNKTEPFLGILLKYDIEKEIKTKLVIENKFSPNEVKVGFIGAGSFAQSFLLPNVTAFNDVAFEGIATALGNDSRTVSDKYGFSLATGDPSDIYTSDKINTVFVATRHNLHAENVIQCLMHGKNVFVEKPLALTPEELDEIFKSYNNILNGTPNSPRLMVGFNRRFAPLIRKLKNEVKGSPVAINYRINAGFIPSNHWTQNEEIGGGRIIGEVCHFVDLAMYIAGSKPVSVSAYTMDIANSKDDTLTINLKFENGSIATVSYFSNGSKELPKEYLEVFGAGVSAVLDDFRILKIYGKSKKQYKESGQDKGHKNEVFEFLNAIRNGKPAPISIEDIYISNMLPFQIIESIRTGNATTLKY
ncbi:MAG: zinc-binding dehydrogenase [Candidatus Lokiarchaeota archaeon]|nr:zinc-binding dehydrogenase [Candidatus Lokiarchaeota archaeon]